MIMRADPASLIRNHYLHFNTTFTFPSSGARIVEGIDIDIFSVVWLL